MSALWIFLMVAAAVFALYLFLIAPRPRRESGSYAGKMYAHRGLYDNGGQSPENSLAAFQGAVDAGYGIELDVQFSRDGELVVFHDETLARVCGRPERVRDLTREELGNCRLASSFEGVPSFSQVLALVKGRTPLIVEIKPYGQPALLAKRVWEALSAYQGPYVVESFHPLAMRWFHKNAPQVIRGQLAMGRKGKKGRRLMYWGLKYLLCNCLSRPDFVAYDLHTDRNLSMALMRLLYRPVLAAWTVRTEKEREEAGKRYDLQIFEGFLPKD